MIPFLAGAFVAGVAGAVGAKVGADVVYPWTKGKVKNLWTSCKCVNCGCVICECKDGDVDFNKK